jgi:asparagine synthase (glutamine-hydrolysing)
MCGISGIFAFNKTGETLINKLPLSIQPLAKRGPDAEGFFYHKNVGLAHRRLSIIDTSSAANQPMTDVTGRYIIVFNGEILNFMELRKEKLETRNCQLNTHSDTEILLQLYINYGSICLQWLRGFFAFAIYDKEENTLFIARDNFGKKPVLIYQDEDKLLFASEMKALLAFDIPKEIDYTSLYQYFQLNYIPSPASIFKGVKKLPQGHFLLIKNNKATIEKYYTIEEPSSNKKNNISYADAQKELIKRMDIAVQRRLIADVPLGAFLSGGIDSSVVVALASKHTQHINTFSIGYKDEPFFDETKYANAVAKKYNTDHTVFSLSNNDLLEHIYDILDYIDEPFADSSCLPSYILCKQTRKKVTVALSGDGGDEVFAGYNKHAAEYRVRQHSITNALVKNNEWLWKILPKSRSGKAGNLIRQLNRFAEGCKLNVKDRYYRWCCINTTDGAMNLFNPAVQQNIDQALFLERTNNIVKDIKDDLNFNEILLADMNGLLVSNMLFKIDMMSMANSLEVRSPFLDVDVVDFAFSLPQEYKINTTIKKRIVQDAFREMLPAELYNRPKQGFDVPLLSWFRKDMFSFIFSDLLSEKNIEAQGIFNINAIKKMKEQLLSNNGGDIVEQLWGMIVFQYWHKKYMV